MVVVAFLAFASPSYAEDTATEVATEAADSAAEEMAEVSDVATEQVAAATAVGLEAGAAALASEADREAAASEAADEATEAVDAAEGEMAEASDAEAGVVVAEEAVEDDEGEEDAQDVYEADYEDDYEDAYPDEYAIVEFTNEDYVLADSWVPSIVFSVVVHEEDTEIEVNSFLDEFNFDRKAIRTMASLRFGGELMTPTFDKVPIKPRFFVSAGVLWSTPGNGLSDSYHTTTSVPDYRDINLAALVRNNPLRPLVDFEGQGTSVQGRQLHNSWYAGLGGVLTLPRSGFTIRVRPSIEYIGEEFRINGEYTLLSEEVTDDPTRYLVHEIDISDKNIYHNIGPGLELEFVNHLDGDFTLSFFTQTRFMWILGDTEMNLKGTDSQGEDAAFRFKRSRFNFRGGIGFRLGFRNTAFKLGLFDD